MRIGELSRLTGVSVRMLRYYEQQGLLRPSRTASGYRHYDERNLRLVERIRALNAAGLRLATLRLVLPCSDERGQRFQPCPQVRPALERELRRISERIAALQSSRRMLGKYLRETAARG